ncbi:hypothetical protein CFC21_040736 [Triticum aestivum]|uniref:Late embryogenesis abundant protein LEA-2 subgroup domain-containing protein n=1 Tax=Triticum aestivum TaxID=4565 RepID=A0A9R1FJ76_WHEAT|nr:hypothetical protein CFC21_040736 [Triticum aestivum]
MKHTTSDSDVTSLATTSPSRSPKRAAYYVVSPSRDSRDDGDKSSSTQATPVYNSPLDSPSHQSSIGPHSRASSASRFSGNLTGGGRAAATRKRPHGHGKGWHEVDVIDEEEAEDAGVDQERELSRSCVAAFWLSVLVLAFTLVCLVVWGAARRDKPSVLVKSLRVENFYAGEGTDGTGVPTKFVTMNCSLEIDVHNPSTMFGIHVSSTSIQLYYSQIPIASGQLDKFYQPKKSRHVASVTLHGEKTPLYGAGATFVLTDTDGVPLTVDLAVRTRGYVIGRLVRVTHAKRVRCPVLVSSLTDRPIMIAQTACSYS